MDCRGTRRSRRENMPRYPSARRYAQAVFQIALEHDSLDMWVEDLQTLADLLEDSEVAAFLDAPQVPEAKKLETIQQLVGESVSTLAANLVALLATKNMTLLMPGILEQFTVMVDRHRGIEWADVTTAVPLDDAQQNEVSRLLSGIVGSEVSLRTYVEPELIGGIVARLNDRVIDGSVRSKLRNMHRQVVEQIG
ncbi:MAG: ATP synthase F1 subunit delta [Dehalococcoidia bacterium]|nr:ATP synthase F1 subunit delta [Dehalococcoidia bacterium]